MNFQSGPQIRNDDVLQIMESTTAHQRADLGERSLFDAFIEADAKFHKYKHPSILAVLSEGLNQTVWVDYIKKNIDRFQIELHGKEHKNYGGLFKQKLKEELGMAKYLIEKEFNVKITTWYPPFGRKGENKWGPEVCRELGIKQYRQEGKVDAKFWFRDPHRYPHINYHYWNEPQVKTINEIICHLHEKD